MQVRIHSVDRDEFTAKHWGTLEDGEIVETNTEAEELFGEFDSFIERVRERTGRDSERLSNEVFWLRECRSYGSQAHREKAMVSHPAIDRVLTYPQEPLVGALQGFERDGSTFESILEVDLTHPYLGEADRGKGHTATVRYQLEAPDSLDADILTDRCLCTATNVADGIVKATEFPHRVPSTDLDEIAIYAYCHSQTVWELRVDYDAALEIDWTEITLEELQETPVEITNRSQ